MRLTWIRCWMGVTGPRREPNTSASEAGAKRRQQASSYKPKCPGCGIFDHVYKGCFYRSHPYFNKDPSIEYAQSTVGIRYCNTFGGRYIKERDMDPSLPKKDRGANMQRNTEFGIRDNVPNTGRFLGHFFFGIRDIVLDI